MRSASSSVSKTRTAREILPILAGSNNHHIIASVAPMIPQLPSNVPGFYREDQDRRSMNLEIALDGPPFASVNAKIIVDLFHS